MVVLYCQYILYSDQKFKKGEEKLLVWNRLPGFNFVLVFFSILIIVIFCHLSLLCLKMALDGLKLVAAIKILQSRMLFEIRFFASFYQLNYVT